MMNGTQNLTNNITGRRTNPSHLEAHELILVALLALVFCIGVIGNSIVIYIAGFKFNKRSKREELILILGVVDLIASVANPPLFIYYTVTRYRKWHFGKIACKILPTLGPVMTCFSAGIIIIMTIDRDRTITSPFKKPFSFTFIYLCVFVAFALSTSSYILYAVNLEPIPGYTCGLNKESGKAYYRVITISILLTQDVLFSVFLAATSVRVYRKVNSTCHVEAMFGNNMPDIRRKRLKRVTRCLIVVGLLFALSTFPRDLFQVSYYFSQLVPPKIKVTQDIYLTNSFLKVLHIGNSCVNIFIYSVMNIKFRKQLLRLFSSKYSVSIKRVNLNVKQNYRKGLEMATLTVNDARRAPAYLPSMDSPSTSASELPSSRW